MGPPTCCLPTCQAIELYEDDDEEELQKLLRTHSFDYLVKSLHTQLPRLKVALGSLLAPAPPSPAGASADADADADAAEDLVVLANVAAAAATTGCYWKTAGCTFGPNVHHVCSTHMAWGKRKRTGECN